MGGPASLMPDDFAEGGAGMPTNKNSRVSNVRTAVAQYQKGKTIEFVPWNTPVPPKGSPTAVAVGLAFDLTDDEGEEYKDRFYSGGSPERGCPSEDGENPSDEGRYIITNPNAAQEYQITKGTNLAELINESINAGFEKSYIKECKGDLSMMFDGLHAHWMGHKPKGRDETISKNPVLVPDQVLEMPGEGKSGKSGKGKGKAVDTDDLSEKDEKKALKQMVELVDAWMGEASKKEKAKGWPRADFVAQLKDEYGDDDLLDAMAALAFQASFKKALKKADYALDGENIVVAEED